MSPGSMSLGRRWPLTKLQFGRLGLGLGLGLKSGIPHVLKTTDMKLSFSLNLLNYSYI